MKVGEVSDEVRERSLSIMDSFTQEQWDLLGKQVQVNVDRDDFADDLEEAEENAPPGSLLFQVRDQSHDIWLFTVKSEDEIIAVLERIKCS